MRFLEIKDGVCVRKEEIIAIESTGAMTCRVILKDISYDADYPYSSLRGILEMENIEEKIQLAPMPVANGQYFAG